MDNKIYIIDQPIEKKKRGPKPKIKTAPDDVIIEKRKKVEHLHLMDPF